MMVVLRAFSRAFFAFTLLTIALLLSACSNAEPLSGVDYQQIAPPVPPLDIILALDKTPVDNDKIEVVYTFWFGCPSCYEDEAVVQQWHEKYADDINWHYLPAPLGATWEAHALLYWLTYDLGLVDQAYGDIFRAIHENRQKLYSFEEMVDFLSFYGVERRDISLARVSAASRLAKSYDYFAQIGLRSVPAMIIDGRYLVLENNDVDKMLDTATYLLKSAQDEH